MNRIAYCIAALTLVAGCDGDYNPITGGDTGTGTPGDVVVPLPGTTNPTPTSNITRYEERDGTGNGYAEDITYDPVGDTFTVDNLAFDGANSYTRSAVTLGPYAVYEGPASYPDDVTGTPIQQFRHRALYAESTSGRTTFAIVRTGSYTTYGFGGFLYKRDGGVTLPTSGQAGYSGQYAGIRDFNSRAGLEYATGDMTMAIDFEDFNAGDAVQGQITNRRIYDINGADITGAVLAALSTEYDNPQTVLPTLFFTVGPGSINSDGEISNGITSSLVNGEGETVLLESGNYYAVVAGPGANEVVGVVVITSVDPRYKSTVRETGGFILYR